MFVEAGKVGAGVRDSEERTSEGGEFCFTGRRMSTLSSKVLTLESPTNARHSEVRFAVCNGAEIKNGKGTQQPPEAHSSAPLVRCTFISRALFLALSLSTASLSLFPPSPPPLLPPNFSLPPSLSPAGVSLSLSLSLSVSLSRGGKDCS